MNGPRVLVTVKGGVATVYAIPGTADVLVVDYDNEPDAEVPHRFQEIMLAAFEQ